MTRTLAIWLTVLLSAFWAVAVLVSGSVIRHEMDEAYDSALEETAARLAPLLMAGHSGSASPFAVALDGRRKHGEQVVAYQLRGADGSVLLRSEGAPRQGFDVPLRPGFGDEPSYRVYTVRVGDPPLYVQTANPLDERREAAAEAAGSLILPLIALIPASGLAVYVAVRRSFRPLAGLRRDMARRGKGDLSPLAPQRMPRELTPIVRSVNRLLGRLREAIDAERAFAASSAHELRTPVAGALAQAQRLVAELPDGPEKERARLIAASISQLGRLSEKLLQMARADSGLGAAKDPVDVIAMVRMVVDEFERSGGHAARVRVEMNEEQTLRSAIDPDALGIVVRNLVENALLHGSSDGPVTVRLSEGPCLSVRNAGTTVPRDVLSRLGSRFHRGPTASAGTGLGLSIVSRLVKSMGGSLELRSPATGAPSGFEALVRFPPSPE